MEQGTAIVVGIIVTSLILIAVISVFIVACTGSKRIKATVTSESTV